MSKEKDKFRKYKKQILEELKIILTDESIFMKLKEVNKKYERKRKS